MSGLVLERLLLTLAAANLVVLLSDLLYHLARALGAGLAAP